MQSAFFKIANVIPYEQAVEEMKKFIVKSFGRKGEDIVKMNYAAVEKGGEVEKVDIPAEWADIKLSEEKDNRDIPDFVKMVAEPMNLMKGDDLPVSAFAGREDGTFPPGLTQYEKRGIAVNVPEWQPETVPSVTSVHMFVLTPASVLSCLMKKKRLHCPRVLIM